MLQGGVDETTEETLGTGNSSVDGRDDTYTGNKRGIDHFDDEQSDPIKTNAMSKI